MLDGGDINVTPDQDGLDIAEYKAAEVTGVRVEIGVTDASDLAKRILRVTDHGDGSVDTLVSIERIELSDNPDTLKITDLSLDAEIVVDMGTSRRHEGELAPGDTLDGPPEEVYMRNLDVADYSGVTHGLIYNNGFTAERGQGLLAAGAFQTKGVEAEYDLLNMRGDIDDLYVKGADKIVLTDHDDVFVKAEFGSVVDLGDGRDKVWLQPGMLIKGFDADDRLTLFGVMTLFGGTRNAASDSPYAVGAYGVKYGLNLQGDLLVINPWMVSDDLPDKHMYIEGWKPRVKGGEFGVGSGPGDIFLAEIQVQTHRLDKDRPSLKNEISIWDLAALRLRTLAGSGHFGPETSDPLVLDLDGDGIELEWRDGSSASFDVDYDLYSEPTAWAGADDGVLARDLNGNGTIDDGNELFGRGNLHGFSILEELDGNGDGVVNAADDGLADFNGDGEVDAADAFGSLLVWRDLNGNRVSEAHELKPVAQHGITSFTLPTQGNGAVEYGPNGEEVIIETINGNHVIGTSTFTRADGTVGTVGEVLLNIDDMNTRYDGPDIPIIAEAATLPNLKGYGTLPDLRTAISYMPDPSDPADQLAAEGRADAVRALLANFDSPDLDTLLDAVKPIAQIWGNAAPYRNESGAITTGLRSFHDVGVLRYNGEIVDYVWGGDTTTQTDPADGSAITVITLELGTGARVTYTHDADAASPAAISGWEDLFAVLFGAGPTYQLDASATDWNLKGADGGRIAITIGPTGFASWLVPNHDTHLLEPKQGLQLDTVAGEEFAFFARYTGADLGAFHIQPAPGSQAVATFIDTLQSIEDTYKQLAVRIAVQDGPLASYFGDLTYDVEQDVFRPADPVRQLGGVFEALIGNAAGQADPIQWLEDWQPLLDQVIGNFERADGDGFLINNNTFLLQNFVDGFEAAGVSLDFVDAAVAIGLPEDVIIHGSGQVQGTPDIDLFYLNGDETLVTGGKREDAYIFGHAIGHVVVSDWDIAGDNSGNQIRFADHLSSEFDVSRSGSDLVMTLVATGETITVKDQFMGEWPSDLLTNAWYVAGIDQIVFADGKLWSDADITREAATVDAGSTTVVGSNDTDYMWGGKGNDRLEGSGDYDIYRFDLGDGHDVIADWEPNPYRLQADSIYFGRGISRKDISLSRDGNSNDYTIHYGSGGDSILIEGAFNKIHPGVFKSFFTGNIENFVFADGTALTEQQILGKLIDTYSTDGNDVIYGFDNDDNIDLGKGNDWAQGGGGNDTYYFGSGYGHDAIKDGTPIVTSPMDEDRLSFVSPIDLGDVEFLRYANSSDLLIRLEDGSELTIQAQFDAIVTGLFSDFYLDRIDKFEYKDSAGIQHTFDWLDLQQILLDRYSTGGNDAVYGFLTDDVLEGGHGDDFLSAGSSDDVYRYKLGDGDDVIRDDNSNINSTEFDILELGAGIAVDDLRVERDTDHSVKDLILKFAGHEGSIRLQNQLWHSNINWRPDEIEAVHFSDGTVWAAADLRKTYLKQAATDGDDVVTGFYSDDTVYGDAGDDLLSGADGSDTYKFGIGDGQDTIYETVEAFLLDDDDRIVFGSGLVAEDIIFSRGSNAVDVVATIASTGETLTIIEQNRQDAWYTFHDIEFFEFADGTSLTKAEVNNLVIASQASTGDDEIWGTFTDETLDGGAGDDTLHGMGGADTYSFGYGDGHDKIDDQSIGQWGSDDQDRVVFDSDIGLSDIKIEFTASTGLGFSLLLNSTGERLDVEVANQIEYFSIGGVTRDRDQIYALALSRQTSAGNDAINGSGLDDTLSGGLGNDVLNGRRGQDTYVYARGDGSDTIAEGYDDYGDRLLLTGILPSTVTFERDGEDVLLVIAESVAGAGDAGSILLKDGLDASYGRGIEAIDFSDGTVWTRAQIQAMVPPPPVDDEDESIVGTDAAEVFAGRGGNDTIQGAGGYDTYLWARGDAHDTIIEGWNKGWEDNLKLEGINASAVTLSRNGNDVKVIVAPSTAGGTDGGSILLKNSLEDNWGEGVDKITVADGTVWWQSDLRNMFLTGTAANETLTGFSGNDTFHYARGGGHDTIIEGWNKGWGDDLKLDGINASAVTLSRNGNDVKVIVAPSTAGGTDGGSILLKNSLEDNWGEGVDKITFADGTVWWQSDLRNMLLTGTAANESFMGFAGNDTFRYARGGGHDTIIEGWNKGWEDNLKLDGINASEVTLSRNGNDVKVIVAPSTTGGSDGGSILLKDSFNDNWGEGVDKITFADGTVWWRADFQDLLV